MQVAASGSVEFDPVRTFVASVGHERRRDGAFAWYVFEDTAEEGRMVETFLVESWLEHLRQHERVTNADRVLQEVARRFNANGTPKVTHLIAAQRQQTIDNPRRVANGSKRSASPSDRLLARADEVIE